tara:strand:- start:4343 stop:6703 length:2361 start_codon:yes stop_codon:yes gene_type:complete
MNKDVGGYPSPLSSNEDKAANQYGLAYFKQMYADWSSDKYINSSEVKGRIIRNRSYAEGNQSIQKYKDQLDTEGGSSYLNLDWTPVAIIPKFVDIIVNGMINQDYEVKANAVDPTALAKRNKARNKMYGEMLMKETSAEVSDITGVNVEPDGFVADMPEEIELYMNLNYKQTVEIAMEKAIQFTLDLNDYPEISKAVYRDLVISNKGVIKTGLGPKGIEVRYVDPLNFISSYSSKPDFSNITHAGEIYSVTIAELKGMAGEQLSEVDYRDIANNYTGKMGNASSFSSSVMYDGTNGYYDYDKFSISILDAEFKTSYDIRAEKKENAHGGYSVNRKKSGYKSPKNSKTKRENISTSVQTKYAGKYIIGTDYIFNYKMMSDISRDKNNLSEVTLSYFAYEPNLFKMKSRSLVDRMVPFADQIQLAHLKVQQVLAKARPKGAAFEVGSLENVSKGDGSTFTPLELQEIYDQTGNIYYRRTDDEGNQTSSMPIQELENGIGRDMMSLINVYNHNLQMIRDVTGINEARDASQPSGEALVGVQKLALLASNNSTRGINEAKLNMTRRASRDICLKMQDLKDYKHLHSIYAGIIGDSSLKSIDMMKSMSLASFGILLEVAPDEQEKAQVEQNIQVSIANGALRLEDAIMVRGIKNTKMANQMLILRREKYKKEKMEEQQSLMEQNAKVQQQSAQQAAQLKQQELQVTMQTKQMEIQAKTQAEAELKKVEYDLKEQFESSQHQRRLEEIYAQNEGKVGAATTNKETRKEIQDKSAKNQSHMIEQRKDRKGQIE